MPYVSEKRQKKYQNDWMQERRRAWLLKNGPCVKCGSWGSLEVDHRNPSEKVDHKVWSWSKERRDRELEKCQTLCETCHLKKSSAERLPSHGSDSRYRHRILKCRCRECTNAHRVKIQEWRVKASSGPSGNSGHRAHQNSGL